MDINILDNFKAKFRQIWTKVWAESIHVSAGTIVWAHVCPHKRKVE